jgi:hypothetical protein
MFAKQELYSLSHTSSTFCSGYFRDKILLLPRPGYTSYFILSAIAGMTGSHHCVQLLVEIGLANFLPGLALNYAFLYISLPCS